MVNHETLSIKQLSTLAGVSVRTLHFYDQIGLLTPQRERENNYRFYSRESLIRLQQILFYREMDLSLEQIGRILNDPAFDLISALENHREALTGKVKRLTTLLQTIDNTIRNLKGQKEMTNGQFSTALAKNNKPNTKKKPPYAGILPWWLNPAAGGNLSPNRKRRP
jgi:DNA-binding transcriptional MerR regulator